MHLEPARALFADDARMAPAVRLGITLVALAVNASATGGGVLGAGFALGLAAFVSSRPTATRWALLAAGSAQALLVLLAAAWLGDAAREGARSALRMVSGLTWALWLGAGLSWPRLARALRRSGVSAAAVSAIDGSVVHALLLVDTLERRRTAAALRGALAPGRARFETYGRILGGSVERAFARGLALEEARTLRAARPGREPRPAADVSRAAVEANGLAVTFSDGGVGLAGVVLRIGANEWVALGGPSGSGKSTLLKAIAGLCEVSAGELVRFGRPLVAGALHERVDARVALVFQDPDDQIFGSTPLDDLVWGLAQHGITEDVACARASTLLENLGIAHVAHRAAHRLSFGERKRLSFAAALSTEPDLLLCDEPTSGLDPVAAQRLVATLERACAARHCAVVWATHELWALPGRIERVVLLGAGRVVLDGPRPLALAPASLARAGLVPVLDAAPPRGEPRHPDHRAPSR
ncbi:MAG: ATP-binding cassette domain-containing protein [Deltaproteobacteria bacterium]|nr:ATP-binding cassette domain-containing protein [Deltaproteobacteria bacterium]